MQKAIVEMKDARPSDVLDLMMQHYVNNNGRRKNLQKQLAYLSTQIQKNQRVKAVAFGEQLEPYQRIKQVNREL